jgi:hypothetical protein
MHKKTVPKINALSTIRKKIRRTAKIKNRENGKAEKTQLATKIRKSLRTAIAMKHAATAAESG